MRHTGGQTEDVRTPDRCIDFAPNTMRGVPMKATTRLLAVGLRRFCVYFIVYASILLVSFFLSAMLIRFLCYTLVATSD